MRIYGTCTTVQRLGFPNSILSKRASEAFEKCSIITCTCSVLELFKLSSSDHLKNPFLSENSFKKRAEGKNDFS